MSKDIKLDPSKLYGFNLTKEKEAIRVSSAASAKIGVPKKVSKPATK
ncbi:MAG: hypothetical protein GY843_17530 [Neptuniibacter sp.]|nr:hypothetical protein [Neptuniibacter sp.]